MGAKSATNADLPMIYLFRIVATPDIFFTGTKHFYNVTSNKAKKFGKPVGILIRCQGHTDTLRVMGALLVVCSLGKWKPKMGLVAPFFIAVTCFVVAFLQW